MLGTTSDPQMILSIQEIHIILYANMISFYIKDSEYPQIWYLAVLELIPLWILRTTIFASWCIIHLPHPCIRTQEGSDFALLTAESQFIEQCLALNEFVINT